MCIKHVYILFEKSICLLLYYGIFLAVSPSSYANMFLNCQVHFNGSSNNLACTVQHCLCQFRWRLQDFERGLCYYLLNFAQS